MINQKNIVNSYILQEDAKQLEAKIVTTRLLGSFAYS